jgi:hypothetical protein
MPEAEKNGDLGELLAFLKATRGFDSPDTSARASSGA